MPNLETSDIQGLLFSGYSKNASACYLLLRITDAARARAWLGKIAGTLTTGERGSYDTTMNVALTARGLSAIGLPDSALSTFALEFREGMSGSDHRSRILGDTGQSAPSQWVWGSAARAPIHVMLMLYARDDGALQRFLTERRAEYAGAVEEVYRRDTVTLPERREHFGFADGIAQPAIEGSRRAKPDAVKAGELLLGYPNEYDKLALSPSAPASLDRERHLHPVVDAAGTAARDLGRNGTYLVVRQLDQHVEAFWQAMQEYSASSGVPNRDDAIRLAAKCVGRWPSGAPLVLSPDRDERSKAKSNDFKYHDADPHGLSCPIGSHIRRTNPRDSLEPGPDESLQVVNRHRILRRGRSYGPMLEPFAHEPTPVERGLFFICVNANIRRQFEFIQQTWSNNPKFDGLYEDKDPLIGDQPDQGGVFTIPEKPVRRRLRELERFVQVRGGEYFFLPGIRTLRFLAALEPVAVSSVAANGAAAFI
ncbi:MAG TPA: Dyp-type peroxidase [Polyangiaceae bacterium]